VRQKMNSKQHNRQ